MSPQLRFASTALLSVFAFTAFAQPEDEQLPRQTIRVEVPVAGDAQGGEAGPELTLPATAPSAFERRRRAVRLGRSPVFAASAARVNGTGFLLRNRLHAPVTIDVKLVALDNAVLKVDMPDRVTLNPLESRQITIIHNVDLLHRGLADFSYHASVGDVAAIPDRGYVYAWPLAEKHRSRISQMPGGPTHREAFSQYAIDIAVTEGTPVIAARAGVVVFLEDRYFESGFDRDEYKDKANHVRVLHEDGSMATYAHLSPDSVDLEPGQRVAVGDVLGRSGNTGYSSGPHLHFAILANRDMEIVSIPFQMDGVRMPAIDPDVSTR